MIACVRSKVLEKIFIRFPCLVSQDVNGDLNVALRTLDSWSALDYESSLERFLKLEMVHIIVGLKVLPPATCVKEEVRQAIGEGFPKVHARGNLSVYVKLSEPDPKDFELAALP